MKDNSALTCNHLLVMGCRQTANLQPNWNL